MPKSHEEIVEEIEGMSNDAVRHIMLTTPWQYGTPPETDADGAPLTSSLVKEQELDRDKLQALCWNKYHKNPQVNTSVRGMTGRIAGAGFGVYSDILEIQETIDEVYLDPRNRLYSFLPKYISRNRIEGELFLMLTVHAKTGFIEVDFIDPGVIQGGDDDGIIYHSKKATMPLFYILNDNTTNPELVPSIFIARYPSLLSDAKKNSNYNEEYTRSSKRRAKAYKTFGGFYRFIVNWDVGLLTTRSVGHLRTTLEWLNYYEDLKKYEIDHKKSSGAYLWVCTFEDVRSYKLWLSLTDTQRSKTGIMAKKTPGGMLVLPAGMKLEAKNPQLPKISEGDTDIMHMITSGLNEPEDVSTGQSKGTFASVKASRGPMSDRTSDEVEYFHRFFRHDFWGSVFFLKSGVGKFPATFKVKEAIGWDGNKKPIFKNLKKRAEELIEIEFPDSEVIDSESSAKAHLGVKHGSVNQQLGIPHAIIARKMGIRSYKKARLQKATEDELYPELMTPEDQEAQQEKQIEPGRTTPAKPKAKATPAK